MNSGEPEKAENAPADSIVYPGIFLAVWAAGLLTLAPGCPHGDSGETAAVAFNLGIAHPPGYPFPTLLGFLFARFLPAGTVAWRVSLLALASSALAAVFGAAILRERLPKLTRLPLFLLGASAGLSLEMWNQATTPKGSVYTVTVALLAGMAWCLARGPSARRLALLGLLIGLAAGGHYMVIVPFLPFLGAALLWSWRGREGAVRAFAAAAAVAVLGASLYLFLPLRAPSAHPALRWAQPVNWGRFSWLVFRRQYMTIEKQPRGGVGWIQARRQFARLASGYSAAGPLLALAGLAFAMRKREWWLVALGAGALTEGAAAAFYPKLEADALWVADGYFSPAFWTAGLLAVVGLAELASALRRAPEWGKGLPGRAATIAAVAWLAWTCWRGGEMNGKSRNYFAHDSQVNMLALAPPNALLFAEGDAYIAPLLYGMYVDGDRPDIRVVIPIFLYFNWGLRELSEQYPDLAIRNSSPWGHVWQEAKDLMEDNRRRPFLYSLTTSTGWPFTPVAVPCGLAYRLYVRSGDATNPAIEGAMMRWRLRNTMNGTLEAEPFDRVVRENYIQAYFLRAIFRHVRGEDGTALALFERGRRLGSPESALNSGLIYYGRGDLASAAKCWEQARKWAPTRPEPWANLGLVATQQGRFDEAIELGEKAVQLKPDFAKAYEVMANAWYRKGDLPQALECLKKAIQAAPNDPNLRKLGAALLRRLQKGG